MLTDAGELRNVLDSFWTAELQALYGIQFDPPDDLSYYRGDNELPCGRETSLNGASNALYCFFDYSERVQFDLDWFQEYLIEHPGGATTFLVLAHEWGHAVQDTWLENGGVDEWSPKHRNELNADCLAGVFLSRSITEGTIIEEVGDADAIFGWLYDAGSSNWLDPGSHGTKEERQQAFADGYLKGTQHCRTFY